jgi:hypothetical protein
MGKRLEEPRRLASLTSVVLASVVLAGELPKSAPRLEVTLFREELGGSDVCAD